jgi:phosphoribosyl-AMP cyclohydrolase
VTARPRFSADGLVPAVVQDASTGTVLMLAYMNDEAWDRTVATRRAWFWSRSRQQLWEKGATSGNTMAVREIRLDCDDDTVLLSVDAAGPACHTGETSCFVTVAAGDARE